MRDAGKIIEQFVDICKNPRAGMCSAIAAGRKVVGVMPYFCPEELAYAAGMLPFGLWGAERPVSESKRYFPAFICSILQTTLEMGIRGELNGLSAIMIPACCDSLKSMDVNWEYGVNDIPVIRVAYAQNRKIPAGIEFTVSQFRKIRAKLEQLAGKTIGDTDIAAAIRVYNENRAALKEFVKAASIHPASISASARCAVIKAGYFMDRAEHTALVNELNAVLDTLPEEKWNGLRVVTTGIIADSPELMRVFEENRITVAADQVAHESVNFETLTPVTEDPIIGMAQRLALIEGSCVLFDPGKERGVRLVELAKSMKADGIIWVVTKFCDPEEFDFVPVKCMADKAGVRILSVEVDQQMVSYEQVRSAVQAFAEVAGA